MTKKHNPDNERIKRKYFIFTKEAKRQNEASVDTIAAAISRFEAYIKYRDFKAFHIDQAIGFKAYLAMQDNRKTGGKLSKATLNSTLRHLKTFFQWLAMQPGYKSRISFTDTEYFNLSEKEARIATAKRKRTPPTIEQIKHVIDSMPTNTDIEKRNRALIAFTLLTGARDSAIASFKIKHINFDENCIFQDAREVKTKFSKTFTTYFFPVGDDIREIVYEWVSYLKRELLWGNDDPLFPKTEIILADTRRYKAEGLKREHWSTASPIRDIFRKAFNAADLSYFNPHSFRNTLSELGQRLCKNAEEFKAWSQNLGHDSVMTTFSSYGEVQIGRQAEILTRLRYPANPLNNDIKEIAKALALEMRNQA